LPYSSSCFISARKTALFFAQSFFAIVVLLSIGCGGGGGSASGGPTPVPTPTPVAGDFSLQIEFSQVTVQQRGASQFLTVFLTRLQNFNGPITIALQGLPAGVTATANGPTTLAPGAVNQGVVFLLSASSSAAVATTTIAAVGTSGSLTHTATTSLIVRAAAPFHVELSASSATLSPGTITPIQVTLVADPGSSPSILLTTLPPPTNGGVTVSIPPFGITTAQPNLTVTLNAELIAQPLQNFPLTFIATDTPTGQTSITAFTLNVGVPFTRTPGLTRSTFIRTDENPTDGVYDRVRKLFFTTITNLNEVRVFSTVDRSLKAIVTAPFPQGIDLSADGSKVYVGSKFVSQITVIDANTLQVIQTVPGPVRSSPLAGDSGLDFPRRLVTLASGKVLLLASHAATTEDHIYTWDPTAGTIVQNDPPGLFSFNDIIRSGDGTKALAYSSGSSGTGISTYDVATDTFSPLLNISSVTNLAYNPDGSQLAGWSGGGSALPHLLVFLDGQFNQLASIPALSGVFSADLIYGLDGTSVYVTCNYPLDGQIVAVFNAQTLTSRGIVPDYKAGNAFDFKAFAIDETGMIYRGDQMGLDLVDVSAPGPLVFPRFLLGSQSANPQLVNLSAPTTVTLGGLFTAGTNRVFFGDSATSPSSVEGTIGTNDGHFTQVTVPAGKAPGATNMIVTRSDGWYATEPDGASFGPQVLFSSVGGPPSGGGKTTIFGYGFVSASTQVTVGGLAASNVQVTGSTGAFPIPLNTITFNAPAGIPGSADITINTARGSVTAPKAYQYLNSAQVFPKLGLLNQIIYDQPRQKLYITNSDHNQVEVFSLASQTFLSPIAVGTNPTGIAQTPDGTLLAVTNEADGTVSVIDPDQAKVVNTLTVIVPSDLDLNFCRGRAVGLTPVKTHRMLVEVDCTALLANGHLRLLDLDTGSFNCTGVTHCNANGIDIDFADGLAAMTSSKDGSKVLLAELGTIGGSLLGFWDVDANQMLTKGRIGGSSQISINADSNTFVFDGGVFDSQLRLLSIPQDATYLNTLGNSFNNDLGAEVNPSGSLLFFPQVSGGLPAVAGGVDIFDLHRQHLALRINLPEPLAFVLDPMALDETGTKMFLISASGITIAQLAQGPLSIGTLSPVAGPAGTLVTIRGSGFQSGAKVTFGSSQVASTFIDINTLQASVPVIPAGPVRVTITNPDGIQYFLDAAFTVN
jgi:YVTN family beta-propeller protein